MYTDSNYKQSLISMERAQLQRERSKVKQEIARSENTGINGKDFVYIRDLEDTIIHIDLLLDFVTKYSK